jgi:hypothetical protein
MGTTLTGTTPQDTYDSLIKVTDNGPISGTLKALSDGLGNDSTLSLSTTAASIAGTLAVAGAATFDTTTLVVDATNNRVGINKATPTTTLDVSGTFAASGAATLGSTLAVTGNATFDTDTLFVDAANNRVGVGTITPAQALDVNGSIRAVGGSYDPTTSAWVNAAFATKVSASPYGGGFSLIDGTAGWTQYSVGSGAALVFAQGATSGAPTTYATLTNGGYFRLSTGGIQFNNDTAAANALNDYEEGTWTMSLTFGGNSVGVNYGDRTGTYTKIGRQVTVTGYMSLSSKGSSTGAAAISGLPFTILNSIPAFGVASVRFTAVTFAGQFFAQSGIGTTSIGFSQITSLGVDSDLTNANFADNSTIIVTLTYFV